MVIAEIRRETYYYADIRFDFTSKIALGLEFFIAGDLIKTIIEPNSLKLLLWLSLLEYGRLWVISWIKNLKELKQTMLENKKT